MSDYVRLLGAEDVHSAGRQMYEAAQEMSRAASNIDGAMARQQSFMEDWLRRFSEAIEVPTVPELKVVGGRTHDLKCWPEPFQATVDGLKRFEFRLDDRGFAVGDVILLKEWDPNRGDYAGWPYRTQRVRVTYILRGAHVLPPGYVVMSTELMGANDR